MLRKWTFSQIGPKYTFQNKSLEKAIFKSDFQLIFSKMAVILDNNDVR